MSDIRVGSEFRRSTRVSLKIMITVHGLNERFTCDGETITVNYHGALISSSVPLRVEMEIEIQVVVNGKHAHAKVVYVDPERPRICGIALEKPENLWDLAVPPDDWCKNNHK